MCIVAASAAVGHLLPWHSARRTALPATAPLPAEIEIEVPVEHGLLVENLLDLAHAPFTHTTTFARGWPVPGELPGQCPSAGGGDASLPWCRQWCSSAAQAAGRHYLLTLPPASAGPLARAHSAL